MRALFFFFLVVVAFEPTSWAQPAPLRALTRTEFAQKLRGLWLAESIANWTGLRTEGKRNEPPFFTQRDWGRTVRDEEEPYRIEFVFQDPWGSDDDTDLEYIYLHLMSRDGNPLLSADVIATGWREYFRKEEFVWVSNLEALRAMRRGVVPPATGYSAVTTVPEDEGNGPKGAPVPNYLMIDAQLTTELFGAVAPGMPELALKIADLPVRASSGSYATHAAQHFVVLYSLAPVVNPQLSPREKVLWLATEARKYVPGGSKAADVFDAVFAKFSRDCPQESAPGCAAWEGARDLLYTRFQRDAKANGFRFLGWTESAVNFGTGIMALLYGQGDLKKTIQIGTLSGWDSDNGTATMGGLLGLMNGHAWVAAQFPGRSLSDRYNIYRTRGFNLPDHLPGDAAAEDTFTMMAERMLPVVDRAVREGGGTVREGRFELPALPAGDVLALSPTRKLQERSANLRVRALGGKVNAVSSTGEKGASAFADGAEHDFSGKEKPHPVEYMAKGAVVSFSVTYDRAVPLRTLRFLEGGHKGQGGQFADVMPEVLISGEWKGLASAQRLAEPDARPNQPIDWVLPQPLEVSGIRVRGSTKAGSATIVELDALSE